MWTVLVATHPSCICSTVLQTLPHYNNIFPKSLFYLWYVRGAFGAKPKSLYTTSILKRGILQAITSGMLHGPRFQPGPVLAHPLPSCPRKLPSRERSAVGSIIGVADDVVAKLTETVHEVSIRYALRKAFV